MHARSMGMIRTDGFPADATSWVRDLETLDAVQAARRLGGRPLLVVHGNEDPEVPLEAARSLADAARAGAARRERRRPSTPS